MFTAKKPEDQLFETMDATDLNKTLKDLMDGLSVKVFRTYNASITLDRLVWEPSDSEVVDAKKADYDRANKEVNDVCCIYVAKVKMPCRCHLNCVLLDLQAAARCVECMCAQALLSPTTMLQSSCCSCVQLIAEMPRQMTSHPTCQSRPKHANVQWHSCRWPFCVITSVQYQRGMLGRWRSCLSACTS